MKDRDGQNCSVFVVKAHDGVLRGTLWSSRDVAEGGAGHEDSEIEV